jgi:hypothetical protein
VRDRVRDRGPEPVIDTDEMLAQFEDALDEYMMRK